MIPRLRLISTLQQRLQSTPVVALLGPRQCGKTTLARILASKQKAEYFDLEDPIDERRLSAPELTLENITGLIILDEIQRKPELFSLLRVLVDRPESRSKYLILGSASPGLVKGISESLAGRASFIEIGGFDLQEIAWDNYRVLWERGSYPRSYLADDAEHSFRWREDFIKSFLERDIPQLGITIPAAALRRFWMMIAHFHGQVWNAAELARSIGAPEATARRYLDLLSGTYVVRQLTPWFENIGKRQVKAPKIYVRDSGLLHTLLEIRSPRELSGHPKYGASWEGFVLEQVLRILDVEQAFYWATHGGAELDLLLFKGGKRYGFEFKCEDAPGVTKSIRIALEDLSLSRVFIIYPGTRSYPVHPDVEVLSILDLKSLQHKFQM